MVAMENITTYGVFDAVGVGSKPYKGDTPVDKPRSIDCMVQEGVEGDPYDGWTQVDTLREVEKVILPDGTEPEHRDTPTFGYDDDKFWRIVIEDEDAGHYRIEEADDLY